MTIDEMIKHHIDIAKMQESRIEKWKKNRDADAEKFHKQLAAYHRQLAEWLTELKEYREKTEVTCKELSAVELANVAIALFNYEKQIAEYKRLLKAAFEDIVWLNEHTVDGDGGCLIETATDIETYLACPLNVKNSHLCGWKHQAEALALIGEDGDTNA